MAFFMEYDESYVAGHKASSITSTDSGEHPPSLYTGHADSCSSLCDPDELREMPVFEDPSPYEPVKLNQQTSISIPLDEMPTPSFYQVYPTCPSSSLAIPVTGDDGDQQHQQELTSHDDNTVPSTFEFKQEQTSSSATPSSLPSSSSSSSSSSTQPTVLTKSEKRVNHIASEQKRRQNIRTGFQQLTDLIPSLKNMPHSKSTILFKTADYIKHSEKRNKVLQERLKQLQRRVALSTNAISAATPYYQHHRASSTSSPSSSLSSSTTTQSYSASSSLPTHHHPASLSHRRPSSSMYSSTQLQIRRLQQQLLQQQELLLQHNIPHQPILTMHYYQPQHPLNAIVMPMSSDEDPLPINSTPCLNIPADDEFGQESMLRERLLSCGKLNLNRTL